MDVCSRADFFRCITAMIAAAFLVGCGIEASIIDLNKNSVVDALRVEPDFVASEVVTTASGVVVRGAFGEISEQKVLTNNVVIEGAFYE